MVCSIGIQAELTNAVVLAFNLYHDAGMQVMPYWGLTYSPIPFQPVCTGGPGSKECLGTNATCRGFENEAAVPGTNNYTCIPYGSTPFDDCWKCPPKVSAMTMAFFEC